MITYVITLSEYDRPFVTTDIEGAARCVRRIMLDRYEEPTSYDKILERLQEDADDEDEEYSLWTDPIEAAIRVWFLREGA